MLTEEIKKCDMSEKDKADLNFLLEKGEKKFVQQYLNLKEENNMAYKILKNLPTQEICKLYDQGLKVCDIGKHFNCHEESIRYHLKKSGYVWDKFKAKWIKPNNKGNNMNAIVPKSKRYSKREVINWLLEDPSSRTVTIEMVAKKFNISRESASNILSDCAQRKILGITRVCKGVYNIPASNSAPVTTAPTPPTQHSIPLINNNESDLKKVMKLSKELGGLDKLIELANELKECLL